MKNIGYSEKILDVIRSMNRNAFYIIEHGVIIAPIIRQPYDVLNQTTGKNYKQIIQIIREVCYK